MIRPPYAGPVSTAAPQTGPIARRRAEQFVAAIGSAILAHPDNAEFAGHLKASPEHVPGFLAQLHWIFVRAVATLAENPHAAMASTDDWMEYETLPSLAATLAQWSPLLHSALFSPRATLGIEHMFVRSDQFGRALHALLGGSLDDARSDMFEWTGWTIGSAYESLLSLHASVEHDPPSPPRLALAPHRRGRRTSTGSFYTPEPLVQHLLDEALDPLIDRALSETRTPESARDAVLALRLCDPACGSGNFLLAAARRLAGRLAECSDKCDEPDRASAEPFNALQVVVERCIYGVDIDPLAVAICQLTLWLESGRNPQTLIHLGAHVRRGDALVGATPELVALGIPDLALQPRGDDERLALAEARKRNRAERRAAVHPTPFCQHTADLWCLAFFLHPSESHPARECITQASLDRVAGGQEAALAELMRDFRPHALTSFARGHGFFHWMLEFPEVFTPNVRGFDLVIGNPPFLNQLESATATARARAAVIHARTNGAAKRYVDEASAFLHLGVEITRPGGRVALVQPQSVLSAADARVLRRKLLTRAAPRSIWIAAQHLFADASVYACTLVLERDAPRQVTLARSVGPDFHPLPPLQLDVDHLASSDSWSEMVASAFGLPSVQIPSSRTLGDFATATADFRDQYYGLDGFLIEHACLPPDQRDNWLDFPAILTAGLIDLACCHWSLRPTRILRKQWTAPRVDRLRMNREGTLGPWITQRLVPKILLASQTRVIEIFVDEHGWFLPSVPVVTIVPKSPTQIWHLAAALASPVAAHDAMRRYAGAALHHNAIKLSARQVLTLPAPDALDALDAAAGHFRAAQRATDPAAHRAHVEAFALAAVESAGVDDGQTLLKWWATRTSSRRGVETPHTQVRK